MSTENPVSPKVAAASAGAGGAAILSSLVLWALGVLFWGQPSAASSATDAIAAVPTPVAGFITFILGVVTAAVSGWKVTDPLRVTTSELKQVQAIREAQGQGQGQN